MAQDPLSSSGTHNTFLAFQSPPPKECRCALKVLPSISTSNNPHQLQSTAMSWQAGNDRSNNGRFAWNGTCNEWNKSTAMSWQAGNDGSNNGRSAWNGTCNDWNKKDWDSTNVNSFAWNAKDTHVHNTGNCATACNGTGKSWDNNNDIGSARNNTYKDGGDWDTDSTWQSKGKRQNQSSLGARAKRRESREPKMQKYYMDQAETLKEETEKEIAKMNADADIEIQKLVEQTQADIDQMEKELDSQMQ